MLNADILHMVCTYLGPPSLRALRLVSQDFADIASTYLFRRVVLRIAKASLQRVVQISQRPKFAKTVHEVVLEGGDSFDVCHMAMQRILRRSDAHGNAKNGRCAAQQLDEDYVVDLLSSALSAFSNLRKATLTSWARDADTVAK